MPPQLDPPHAGVIARGVGKSYKAVRALAPTDLDVAPGSLGLLVGANGTGKTTLLRVLATLVTPDEGTAFVGGYDVRRQGRQVRECMGLCLVNERSLFWRLRAIENLELFAEIRGLPRRERRPASAALLEELGLSDLAGREIHTLSAGQRQRLILARALVGEPSVLLIDEPLRGLDVDAADRVITALRRRAQAGGTVVIATPSTVEYGALDDVVPQFVSPHEPAEAAA